MKENVRVTVLMDYDLKKELLRKTENGGYSNFSEYIRSLIRNDDANG